MDKRDTSVPDEHHAPRTGDWMSQDKRHQHAYLNQTIKHVDANPPEKIMPVLEEFQEMVEKDSRLHMLFEEMFNEVPHSKPYLHDISGQFPSVRDFKHFILLLNHVLSTAPGWTDAGHSVGMVGVPVNALLDWPMATRAGHAVFLDPQVNAMMKKVLNVWGEYLVSPASAAVLSTDKSGWFGETGIKSLTDVANNNGSTSYTFEEMFVCSPKEEHHGYKSWDDFFTRLFRFEDGIRPVAEPEDDNVVANCCESKTYKIAHNVKRRDKFWIKGQPYSVVDMLNHDPLAEQFVGGTIYQAFLSALSYHRWHTPVSGTVKKVSMIDGTYYSEPLFEDFTQNEKEARAGETISQEYLSVMSARAIIYIEADNPKIGLMAIIEIGMTEVSSCEVYPKEGDKVKKGDLMGSFHFGGSSHCVLFRKGVKVEDFPQPGQSHNVPVRSKLCRVH